MARTAKMMDVMVACRMAKMRVTVIEPIRVSAYNRTTQTISEAMRLAGDAELNTQPRSNYRNALIN